MSIENGQLFEFIITCWDSISYTSLIYTLQKSNTTRLWSIIFLLSWIFIHHVRYLWKACLSALRLMPYLLGLFYWGACRVSKLRATPRRKGCKIDRIEWEMRVISWTYYKWTVYGEPFFDLHDRHRHLVVCMLMSTSKRLDNDDYVIMQRHWQKKHFPPVRYNLAGVPLKIRLWINTTECSGAAKLKTL